MNCSRKVQQRFLLMLLVLPLCFSAFLYGESIFFVQDIAYADTFVLQDAWSNKVLKVSAKEQKAYDRAVTACMDYLHQPNPIIVDMSDLKLSSKQALAVGERLHENGELFWINSYNDSSFGSKQFSLPCYFEDADITKKRKQLNMAVNKALKRIGPGMTDAVKVHMLHDYLVDKVKYVSKQKNSYTGLVLGQADCFGYSLSMDVLLRRAGFLTDMATNKRLDHAWNVVKVGSKWYHVDVTFDTYLTGKRFTKYFNWKNERCHLYLLQSDAAMNSLAVDPKTEYTISSHAGWVCRHACTDFRYDDYSVCGAGGVLQKACNNYKHIVRTFKVAGVKYMVTNVKKVVVAKIIGAKQRGAKTLKIPAKVSYKRVKYSVSGISSNAFANTRAKILKIYTAAFSKTRVKGSLTNSKVLKVLLCDTAKKKKKVYKSYFSKANSGKKVKVTLR